jgi:radical SAM protein with 4Fe4S-binding SPASM domain
MVLELTSSCNLDCKYCYVSEERRHKKPDNEKAIEITENFLGYCDRSGKKFNVLVIQGAECTTLNSSVLNQCIIKLLSVTDTIRIQTNGKAMSTLGYFSSMMESIPTSKIQIQLSIDGPKDLNDFNRGIGTYEAAMNTLHRCNDVGIRTTVVAVVTKESVPYLVDGSYSNWIKTLPHDRVYMQIDDTIKDPKTKVKIIDAVIKSGEASRFSSLRPSTVHNNGYSCEYVLFKDDYSVSLCNRLDYIANSMTWDNIESTTVSEEKNKFLSETNSLHSDCLTCSIFDKCFGGCPALRTPEGKAKDCEIKKMYWKIK